MSDAYTPTTEKVRGRYATAVYEFSVGGAVPDPDPEFDRWYQAEVAAAEQRGAIKALRDAANLSRTCWAANKNLRDPDNPEASYSFDRWLEVRADRLEGDDEQR